MTVRFEIFPSDLEATTDLYTRVLGFSLAADQRDDPQPYLVVQRDGVRIGAAGRQDQGHGGSRRAPTGVELVFEVDDLVDELDRCSELVGLWWRTCKHDLGACETSVCSIPAAITYESPSGELLRPAATTHRRSSGSSYDTVLSGRTRSASTLASPASLLAREVTCRSRYRDADRGLIANTW
jgi:predicted enzyme related to lactoylglutathione lyase